MSPTLAVVVRTRIQRTVICLFALVLVGWLLLPESLRTHIQPKAQAASFTVNSLGDTPDASPGNGSCADAGGACTLRAAIQEANTVPGPNTISFSVTGTIDLNSVLPMLANIHIQGPGASLLTVRRNTAGGTPNFRIFRIPAATASSISRITVANGRTADGVAGGGFASGYGGPGESGGGILNNGVLTLTDVVVTGNRTGDGGAGTSGTGGPGGYGAGIYSSGPLTMTGVTVSSNTAGNGAVGFFGGEGGKGGGIYFTGSALTITDSSFLGNTAGNGVSGTSGGSSGSGGDGGGINADKGPVNLTNVIIDGNHAGDGAVPISSSGGRGGGLFTWPGVETTMTNCQVSNNNSGQGGTGFSSQGGSGGGIDNFGPMTIVGSTINGNFTKGPSAGGGGSGAGIFNNNLLTIMNSTISGNNTHADRGRGGGIYNNGASVSLINSTIAGNTALTCCGFQNGQGIHTTGTANVRNTIIAGNGNGSVPDVTGDFNSQGHNLIGRAKFGPDHGNSGDQTGFNNGNNGDQVGTIASPIDALLGPLTNNGGATFTHALLTNSPALDSGDNCVTQAAHCGDANIPQFIIDQRGAGRSADSPDADTTATVDIGAYEFHQTFENVSDKTISEDTQLVVSFSLGDGGPAATSVTASSDNTTLLPDANLQLSAAGSVRTLKITPVANQFGVAQITLTVNYTGGGVLTDSFQVTVTPINDMPTFTVGANQTTNEDSGLQTIPNWATLISAGPNESGQSLTFQVTANSNPSLFSTDPSINAAGTLTYTPATNAAGSSFITLVLKDDGGTANGGKDTSVSQSFQITVTPVNDAPTFTKGADQNVSEDTGFQSVPNWATLSAGPNESGQSLFSVVTTNTNPGLFAIPPSVNLQGTLTYSPAFNVNGSAQITMVIKDTGGTANGGQDTSPPQTFTINVAAVNDAPVNSVPFIQSTSQNVARVFSAATFNRISVSDIDAGNEPVRMTLTATNGHLTIGSTAGIVFVAGDGNEDVTMTFTGAIAAINTAMDGLRFKPDVDFAGAAGIQITTDDQGHSGSGGAKTDTDTIPINVLLGGRVQFSGASYQVNENTGIATVTVVRTGGSSGSGSVSYSTSAGTATQGSTCSSAGADYRTASGILSWGNGDSSTKSFDVLLCNDGSNEPDETIQLTLSNPTGSLTLGTTASSVLSIVNDDMPILLTAGGGRAIAFDLVTQMIEPFKLTNSHNLSTDQRQRVSLFVWRLGLLPGDTAANMTARAEDSDGGVYNLPVEYVSPLTDVPDVTQVVVRLPDAVVGAPRDLRITVTLRGPGSTGGLIRIAGP